MDGRKAIIVALSGCSSSGKTTLARLLRDIFPDAFILHEDDFYRPETELPMKNGLLDWDCAEAIDIPAMADALSYIIQHASLPPSLDSKEDKNSVGTCPVSPSTIASLKAKVAASLPPRSQPDIEAANQNQLSERQKTLPWLCLLDGFLLYPPSMSLLHPHLDVKFFLRVSHARAKARREARDGYITLEGFWADPPGYVDKIVWPNYVESHAWLFEGGDVEGGFRVDVLEREGIRVPPTKVDGRMDGILEWMVGLVLTELRNYA